ncbi:MAG: polysaccharide deacetylase family protein [Bryobacteraceae bacterium]|nr:polysaccharide deacetylase family protein [Bryobacteraceae bacterium]
MRAAFHSAIQSLPHSVLNHLAATPLAAPCFHLVADQCPPHVRHLYPSRTPERFQADLDWLLRRFRPVGLDDLTACVRNGRPFPKNSAFLSFDDGFREMYEIVAPICLRKGVPATFFLATAFLDNRELCYRHKASLLMDRSGSAEFLKVTYRRRKMLDDAAVALNVDFDDYLRRHQPYLTTNQVNSLRSQGFTIGGHSVDHPPYAELILGEQLEQTRRCLAAFQPRARAFAFPFVSTGINRQFYHAVFAESLAEIIFCIGDMPTGYGNRLVQRFGVEDGRDMPLNRRWREEAGKSFRARLPR